MVAFDRCNVTENSQCVTDDEAKSALELSYINTFENRETFVHYEKPTSGKALTKETLLSWFPITTTTRTDSVKKVTVTEVQQSWYRFGFGFSTQIDQIFQNVEAKTRVLPYKNNMLNSVTYEVSPTKYVQLKIEYSFLQYISDLGGFGSVLLGLTTVLNAIDSPQLFVASDLLAQKGQQIKQ